MRGPMCVVGFANLRKSTLVVLATELAMRDMGVILPEKEV
jgi:hypothetical protein